jgi:DNA modification methylase
MTIDYVLGDCRDPKIVRRVMEGYGGDRIKCVVTDPPFGADFVSRRAVTPQGKARAEAIEGDGTLEEAFGRFTAMYDAIDPWLDPDECEMYVFTRWDIVGEWIAYLREMLGEYGWSYKMLLVWDKGIPGMGDIDSNWGCGHELILYLKRGRREVAYRRSSIIAVDKVHGTAHIHPTEKPVPLLNRLIEMSTNEGDLVYDGFAGSASALVAADGLHRRAVGFEVNEDFFNRAVTRIEASRDIFSLD